MNRPVVTIMSLLLGLLAVVAALSTSVIIYGKSLEAASKRYQQFYLDKAKYIVDSAQTLNLTANEALEQYEKAWLKSGNISEAEYICIVDNGSNLVLHSAHPETVGNYCGNNLIFPDKGSQSSNLLELVKSKKNYVGKYVSSAGQKQIAAFVAIPEKEWVLGLHRSEESFLKEVEEGIKNFKYAFLVICVVLMPALFLLLFITFTKEHAALLKSNHKLAASEQKYKRLISCASDAIIIVDKHGFIISWNDIATDIFGYKKDEIIGEHMSIMLPQDRRSEQTNAWLKLEELDNIDKFETVRLAKDGTEIDVEISVGAVKDDSGKLQMCIAVVRDIRDRNKMHAERQMLDRQMMRAQKLEAVGQLAGGIAHDFNNILAVASGHTELLQAALAKETHLQRNLAKIAGAIERATGLVREFLIFSKKEMLYLERFDMSVMVTGMENDLMAIMGDSINFSINDSTEGNFVYADRNQIEHVITNLCFNSRDAMPDGGELFIELSKISVGEKLCRSNLDARMDDYILLKVKDTGEGMSEGVSQRIFEPFFTTKDVGKGAGLGLATAYAIIKRHGGFINVESELKLGTTFYIYLPYSN